MRPAKVTSTAAHESVPEPVVVVDVLPSPVSSPKRTGLVRGLAIGVVVAALGFLVPQVIADHYYLGLALDGVVLSLLTLGIGFLYRYLGLISLGHCAVFGAAAYGVGIANNQWHLGPMPSAAFGFAAGLVIAAVIGAFTVRVVGMAFLMLTLVFGQALFVLVGLARAQKYTGSDDGLLMSFKPGSSFVGVQKLFDATAFWPVAWAALAVVMLAFWLVGRTGFATILCGIRDNEERMRFAGYNTTLLRFYAFVLSAAAASLGGVLLALNKQLVTPSTLGFDQVANSMIAAIVGGLGMLGGPVLGAVIFVFAQSAFSSAGNIQLYTGIALIVIMAFFRGGITGLGETVWRYLRARRRRTDEPV